MALRGNKPGWTAALLLCAAGVPPAGIAQDGAAARPGVLPEKEALTYSVEWRLVTAGKAQLDWTSTGDQSEGWEARLHLESTGLVSKLFKVNDLYTSRLAQDLCAQSSHIDAQEGTRRRDTRITFDGEAGKAKYLEKDLVRNTVVATRQIDIPACVYDVVGGLFKLRTMRLEPGQNVQVAMSNGKKSVMARVEAQQREEIRTPAGTFKTVRYEAYLFNDVLFQRSARLHVWLTDDARKLPVQIRIRMQFTVGTITLQLEKEERGQYRAVENHSAVEGPGLRGPGF